MESMGVYLRDYNKVAEAWKLYREFKVEGSNDTEKLETAISLYQDANHDIDVLAQGWGMDFTILCDLTHLAAPVLGQMIMQNSVSTSLAFNLDNRGE